MKVVVWVGFIETRTAGSKELARASVGVCRGCGVKGKVYKTSKN
jgi:hypothetical protein